mmetsp:Transcript_29125/g.96722  ORF Transcript_29125/g.96722 Transcript_29125/m.96722 type:complete len:262 (-) Transcript_29125:31-816(-)
MRFLPGRFLYWRAFSLATSFFLRLRASMSIHLRLIGVRCLFPSLPPPRTSSKASKSSSSQPSSQPSFLKLSIHTSRVSCPTPKTFLRSSWLSFVCMSLALSNSWEAQSRKSRQRRASSSWSSSKANSPDLSSSNTAKVAVALPPRPISRAACENCSAVTRSSRSGSKYQSQARSTEPSFSCKNSTTRSRLSTSSLRTDRRIAEGVAAIEPAPGEGGAEVGGDMRKAAMPSTRAPRPTADPSGERAAERCVRPRPGPGATLR